MVRTTKHINKLHRGRSLMFVLICSALVFLLSVGSTAYGAWQVTSGAGGEASLASLSARLVEAPVQDSSPRYPGEDISQDILVENTGNMDIFVRMKVQGSLIDIEGNEKQTDISLFNIVYNTASWKDGGDGYYYMRGALVPGALSAPLMESATLSTNIPGTYAGYDVVFSPQMEAIQTTEGAVTAVWGKSYEFMEAHEPTPTKPTNPGGVSGDGSGYKGPLAFTGDGSWLYLTLGLAGIVLSGGALLICARKMKKREGERQCL